MSIRLIAAEDLLRSEAFDPEWVIYPLCMRGSSVMMYGRQGIGKSSATVQLAHSLITGEPWMGFKVERTGPVIYVQIDMAQQETRRLLERATEAGLDMGDQLYVTGPEEGEESVTFNILDPGDWTRLKEWCERVQPIAVIVDTIHDGYEYEGKNVDVNAMIRKIHRGFKSAIGGAVLVFLNHMRKQSKKGFEKGEESDDEDSFMGGQAWEGIVAASLHLVKKKDHSLALKLRKLRLDTWPGAEVPLVKDDFGFFHAKLNDAQMLAQWPDFLPLDEREAAIASVRTKTDVFSHIAKMTGSSLSAIRMRENRKKGCVYPWVKYLKDKDGEE